MNHALDNPVWSSLLHAHGAIALGDGQVKRYPADVAPFAAVPSPELDGSDPLLRLVGPDERIYFLGVRPRLDERWEVAAPVSVAQWLLEEPAGYAASGEVELLGAAQQREVFEFASKFYPPFFRERTCSLGTFVGVRSGGRLAALGGERMHVPGYREVSTVCTHPEHTRHGYAARIVLTLLRRARARDERVFVHTVNGNRSVDAALNRFRFQPRAELPMWACRRAPVPLSMSRPSAGSKGAVSPPPRTREDHR